MFVISTGLPEPRDLKPVISPPDTLIAVAVWAAVAILFQQWPKGDVLAQCKILLVGTIVTYTRKTS